MNIAKGEDNLLLFENEENFTSKWHLIEITSSKCSYLSLTLIEFYNLTFKLPGEIKIFFQI